MPSDESDNDPEILARWLTLASLVASADELATRGGVWTTLALAAADSACEGILGFIARRGTTPLTDRESWEQIFDLAIKALVEGGRDLPQSLRTRIIRSHRLRNLALHVGAEPTVRAAESAVKTARDLMEFASQGTPELELIASVGLLEAVGRLVAMTQVSEPLIAASVALKEENYLEAADQSSIALEGALTRVTPRLRADGAVMWRRPTGFRDLDEPLGVLSDRATMLEAWVLALGTGLKPSELAELRHVLGEPSFFVGGRIEVFRDPEVALTPSAVTRAALQVADVIFRLWSSSSLKPHRWERMPDPSAERPDGEPPDPPST